MLVCIALCLLTGCGASPTPPAQNLRWDVDLARQDLLLTRLQLGEQRRRLRQAQTDAALVGPQRASLLREDAAHARDGVAGVANAVQHVQETLSYVARDVAALHGAPAAARGVREQRRIEAEATAALAEARALRMRIERLAALSRS